VREVGADKGRPAVDQRIGKGKLVERLVPELALRVGREDAGADAGERRGEHDGLRGAGVAAGDCLSDAAADVVADQDHVAEAELGHESADARRLSVGGVGGGPDVEVAIGISEAPEVRNDDVGAGVLEAAADLGVVRGTAGPAVQEDDGRTAAVALVGEAEPVDGRASGHERFIPDGA
jgi:hypothetical protein